MSLAPDLSQEDERLKWEGARKGRHGLDQLDDVGEYVGMWMWNRTLDQIFDTGIYFCSPITSFVDLDQTLLNQLFKSTPKINSHSQHHTHTPAAFHTHI